MKITKSQYRLMRERIATLELAVEDFRKMLVLFKYLFFIIFFLVFLSF